MKKILMHTYIALSFVFLSGSIQAAQQQERLKSTIYTAIEAEDHSQALPFDEKLNLVDIIYQQIVHKIVHNKQSRLNLRKITSDAVKIYKQTQTSETPDQEEIRQQELLALEQLCQNFVGDNYKEQQKYIIRLENIIAVRLQSKDAYTLGYAGYVAIITALTIQDKLSLYGQNQLPYIDTLKHYTQVFKQELRYEKKNKSATPPTIEQLIVKGQQQGLRNLYPVTYSATQNSIAIVRGRIDSDFYDYPADNLGNVLRAMIADQNAQPIHLLMQDEGQTHYQLISLVKNPTNNQLIALLFDPRDNKNNTQRDYHQGLCAALANLIQIDESHPPAQSAARLQPRPMQRDQRRRVQNSNPCPEEQHIVHAIKAQVIERFQTDDNQPAAIRVSVLDQKGHQCGLNAIANIQTIETALEQRRQQSFIAQSQSAFNALSRTSQRQERLSDEEIVRIIQQSGNHSENIYFGSIGFIRTMENKLQIFTDPRLSQKTFDQALGELLDQTNQTTRLHVILHTRSIGADHTFRDHWTTLSIVKTNEMQKPVIVVMDSLGNQARRPVRPKVKQAVQLLAYRMSRHMLARTLPNPEQTLRNNSGNQERHSDRPAIQEGRSSAHPRNAHRTPSQARARANEQQEILQKLSAQQISVIEGEMLRIIRITAPSQTGASCGAHAIANSAAIDHKLANNTDHSSFINQSGRQFRIITQGQRLNLLDDTQLVLLIKRTPELDRKKMTYIGSIGAITGQEEQLHIPFHPKINTTTFENAVIDELLNPNKPTTAIHVILNNNRQHWTSASIIKTAQMTHPVIVVTNSVGNRPNASFNPIIELAIRLLAKQVYMLSLVQD